ncbi:MAG: hemerythrin domain-containing protein [Actinomycetota bacterium]|nr:hemerythrin domain-containing protein [Actinomycetota bacterium]
MAIPAADAVSLLMREHRLAEQLFLQLDAAVEAGDQDDQRELADRILTELSAHAAIEEEVLYPAARAVPDAAGAVDRSLAEHKELETVLARLEGTDPGDARFAEGFRQAREMVDHHVAEEEGELFPVLRRSLADDELASLRDRLVEARSAAPTRPRPSTPVAAVADAATSLIDKAKGAIRSLGPD